MQHYSNEKAKRRTLPRMALVSGAVILLSLGVLLAIWILNASAASQTQSRSARDAAPDFTFITFDGSSHALRDFRGQVVILNFWASWCGPCRVEAPVLQATWERYRNNNVAVIGIAFGDTREASLDFIENYGLTYLNGPDDWRISEAYFIRGLPVTYIIDQNGNIMHTLYAAVTGDALSEMLDNLLNEAAG